MKIKMFSYGGSGLKFLTTLLDKYVDAYHLNHNPHAYPENSDVLTTDKSILIYSDPRNSLLSFFRRNQLESNKNRNFLSTHLKHMGVFYAIPLKIKLIDFLSDDEKYKKAFDLEEYFTRWLNFDLQGRSLAFIKYENILDDDVIKNLANYLNINFDVFSQDLKSNFKIRSSIYSKEDKQIQLLLFKKYDKLIKLQNSLPSFYLKT